jgi:hypothetical protein
MYATTLTHKMVIVYNLRKEAYWNATTTNMDHLGSMTKVRNIFLMFCFMFCSCFVLWAFLYNDRSSPALWATFLPCKVMYVHINCDKKPVGLHFRCHLVTLHLGRDVQLVAVERDPLEVGDQVLLRGRLRALGPILLICLGLMLRTKLKLARK